MTARTFQRSQKARRWTDDGMAAQLGIAMHNSVIEKDCQTPTVHVYTYFQGTETKADVESRKDPSHLHDCPIRK